MRDEQKSTTLATQIRKAVTHRIFLCLLIVSITAGFFSIYDVYNSFTLLQRTVKARCDSIKNYIISQLLIDNEVAIQDRLDTINHGEDSISFAWVSTDKIPMADKITLEMPWSWNYYYPVTSFDNVRLGYLRVHGSFFADRLLFYQFLIRLALLIMFTISMFLLLFPLAKKIPQILFVKPIDELLKLIKLKDNDITQKNINDLPLEINEISNKIKSLFKEIEKSTREVTFMQVASQVAHDIRSPLVALDIIIKDITNIPENQRVLMRSATNRIRDIANNLLTKYSKDDHKDSAKASPELISDLVLSVLSEKRVQYKNLPIDFATHIDDHSYHSFINVSASNFKRVISNLLDNAVEALTFKTTETINIKLFNRKGYVDLIIQDNGSGMSPELLSKIISGEKVSEKKNGNGLGLPNAIKMVEEEMDGQFVINSRVNKGTTIEIILPKSDPPNWFVSKIVTSSAHKVVILDDDESIHRTWQNRFAKTKNQLINFYCTNDLIEWNKNNSDERVLYLVDYELIDCENSGLDVIEKIMIANRSYLVTSRYDEHNIRKHATKLGVKIIPKNFAAHIPIFDKDHHADVIFIDDNKTLTDAWSLRGEKLNKTVDTFNKIEDLRAVLEHYKKDTPIYIDFDLKDNVTGVTFSKELYEAGFTELYLATGYCSGYFGEIPWVKGIIDKVPPF